MNKRDRRGRPALMTGVALAGLMLGAGAASAQSTLAVNSPPRLSIDGLEDAPHGGLVLDPNQVENVAHASGPAIGVTFESYVGQETIEEPQVVISQPGTPTTARDPANITGIGQMIVAVPNGQGGFGLGLCTGSLINPRTVLFAAHCVNSRPATAYGAESGGLAISFGFNTANNTTQPGQPAGTSPLLNWLFGSTAQNRAAFTTSTNEFFYSVNGLVYNPLSLDPAAAATPGGPGFLFGDVAIASLDTPARNVPTWALLLSALTPPTQITAANGTGYHVTIAGYGRNGIGTTGDTGAVDFRRRIAENWLGALTSLNVRDTAIFGGFSVNRPQNLYWTDFDDPRRGTTAATPFDFNLFRDNALPNEGITAGGDSGGPLILDRTFAQQVVIGVLSGGSRFFPQTPTSSYGTASFYQPLYLYWDWIAQNNPYRYVGAAAGNGNWEDASRWVSLQDPNYFIIGPNGQLVNGVPAAPGEQNLGTSGQFGQICTQGAVAGAIGLNNCLDLRTNTIVPTPGGIGSSGEATLNGSVGSGTQNSNNLGSAMINADGSISTDTAQNVGAVSVLPAATIANGLPGATGFVPNNTAGNRLQGVLPRYFDVTLSNSGLTTLSSNVTIDRLTLRGPAGLGIASNGTLTSLIDITQAGGTMTVNGRLNSVGDYTVLGGLLQGTGTIAAPFVNSVAGTIAPGTIGTTGTLSINGNLVLASGTQYLIDVAGTTSDRIAVTGLANIGGQVVLGNGVTGQVNGLGRQFTILTSTGGVTGTFTAQNLSALLSQRFTYQTNAVLMEIRAASYSTVIDPTNPVQAAYAQLLDQNRSNAALASLYGLDFASVDSIRSTFTGLAPVNEQAVRSIAGQTVNLLQNFNDARLREADKDKAGGKIAITGRPLELAQMSLAPALQPMGGALMGLQDGETEVTEANLPENVAIFLAGGFINGDTGDLPGFTSQREMEGYSISGGIEFYPGENTMLGLSGYFNSIEAGTALGQQVDSETYAASLYMRHKFAGGPVIDGQFSMGSMGFDTQRQVQILGGTQTLESSSDDLLVSGALGISYDLESSIGTISPGIEARYASVDLARLRESGGTVALAIDRESFKSTQARFGFDYEKQGKMLAVNATAQLVWEFEDGPQLLGANFVQGTGPNANFVLETADHTWGELGINATFGTGPVQMTAGIDTTIGRDNADAQVVRVGANWRF
ncbi:autotransporter domain-containing protein [Porphyrobacter sp. ULC335]|uniref:autotransporter domain-containing protein n=1 Tax=Porphyrobacter sp. ULC335 TaxID=2854260 RepID=UPI00221FA06F|nr:autotransporter domain-containing protein [Porphyrobacter sp. ULC335]UYV17206.1 autotransporter domain-containing protein [Porphyrobacter sp. ULC335]